VSNELFPEKHGTVKVPCRACSSVVLRARASGYTEKSRTYCSEKCREEYRKTRSFSHVKQAEDVKRRKKKSSKQLKTPVPEWNKITGNNSIPIGRDLVAHPQYKPEKRDISFLLYVTWILQIVLSAILAWHINNVVGP
jgi:hypothetical protein